MKPYYEHAGITIYHGDCREVLPMVGDNSADLIITDPPYGVNFKSGWRQESFMCIEGDHSTEISDQVIPLMPCILRDFRHAYIFGRFAFDSDYFTPSVELIWDKGSIGIGDLQAPWGKQHEYIQFLVNRKANPGRKLQSLPARLRKGSVLSFQRVSGGDTSHPTEKPVLLLRELIESSSRIGETVMDMFCGSGSTLVAAKLESRKAIGIEIEEKYCEMAAKRFSQEVFEFETGVSVSLA